MQGHGARSSSERRFGGRRVGGRSVIPAFQTDDADNAQGEIDGDGGKEERSRRDGRGVGGHGAKEDRGEECGGIAEQGDAQQGKASFGEGLPCAEAEEQDGEQGGKDKEDAAAEGDDDHAHGESDADGKGACKSGDDAGVILICDHAG